MESFSSNTLTILVIVGIISSGLAFTAVSILIIYLLWIKNRRSDVVSPAYTDSIVSSDSYDSRSSSVSSSSSSVSSIPVKSPVIISTKRKEQRQSRLQKQRSNSISTIDENPSDNEKKHQQVYKRNENDETIIRSESRIYTQHHQQRLQQQPVKLRRDIRVMDRTTPYPPDVIARERVMMTYGRFPIDEKHNT